MQRLTAKQNQIHFRKDRGWLLLNGIVYSAFGFYAVKELFFSSEKMPLDYMASGIILIAAIFVSVIYWKSFNMYLIVHVGRARIKGWWQEIDILFQDIEKCELHSENYSKSCILHLKNPLPKLFHFSWNLPIIVLEKDRRTISLSSFLSEEDWVEFEKIVCQEKIST